MIENLKDLFKRYEALDMPCIVSAFVSDGRRIMFVVIGFQGSEVIGITRDSSDPAHINPNTVIEWRDCSTKKNNIITDKEAKAIYEKYVSVKIDTKALDEPQRTEGHQANGAVEEHGTAVEAI